MKNDIVRRYRGNPILTKAAIPYPVETIPNAAVVKHGYEYVMLFRSHFTADPEPFLTPSRDGPFAAYEEFGVEDPRMTLLEGSTSSPIAPTREMACGSPLPTRRTSVTWKEFRSSPRRTTGT